jgi:hypothetical protein
MLKMMSDSPISILPYISLQNTQRLEELVRIFPENETMKFDNIILQKPNIKLRKKTANLPPPLTCCEDLWFQQLLVQCNIQHYQYPN